MENPEEILHSLEEFAKLRPKDIPRELEEYLCFVAKTGDPIYQWSSIKMLFREKLINVITEFYESCPSIDIPPCPNVDVFNYEIMKNFILEKLDTFAAAPFTVQRICELLTTPRKEYNRIDKYMRALEKNILVVSTTEPGNRRSTENGENVMNGIESENGYETNNSNNDINVEEMDDVPSWPRLNSSESTSYQAADINEPQSSQTVHIVQETFISESSTNESACTSTGGTVITKTNEPYVSIEPIASDDTCNRSETSEESDVSVTITAIPAAVQKRRDSIEPVVSSEQTDQESEPVQSSSESEHMDNDGNDKDFQLVKSSLEPLINVESSITTSETESNTPTCSEPAEEFIDENTVDDQISTTPEKEDAKEVPDDEPAAIETENFVVEAVSEDVLTNDEISTSDTLISKETESETKESIITSSDSVEAVSSGPTFEDKPEEEEISKADNEAEPIVYPEEKESSTDELPATASSSVIENVEERETSTNKEEETTEESTINELAMDVDQVEQQEEKKTEENVVA